MADAIVFVEGSPTGMSAATARISADLGFETYLLCSDPGRYDYLSALDVTLVEADTSSADTLVAACERIAAGHRIRGLASTHEFWVERTSVAALRLGLPSADPMAVRRCRSKIETRRALDAVPSLNPRYRAVQTGDEAVAAGAAIEYPVIIKPSMLAGSSFVQLCHDEAALKAQFDVIAAFLPEYRGDSEPGILVEEYVEGPSYSSELLNGNSIGLVQKQMGELPHFVSIGNDYPAELSRRDRALLHGSAVITLDLVGLRWGGAQIEFRMTESGPKVMEINARPSGNRIPELLKIGHGIDYVEAYVRSIAGLSYSAWQSKERCASSKGFIAPPTPSQLKKIRGLERARSMPGIVDIQIYISPGEVVGAIGANYDRIGVILSEGETVAQSRRMVEEAAALVCFEWEDPVRDS